MELQPFSMAFAKVVLIGAVTLAVNFMIPRSDIVIGDMVLRSAIIAIVFGGLAVLMKVSPDGNKLVATILKSVR